MIKQMAMVIEIINPKVCVHVVLRDKTLIDD